MNIDRSETNNGGLSLTVHAFSDTVHGEISMDSIIPDTVADVSSVLLCTVTPHIDEYYIANHYLVIEGTADFQVLLTTDSGNPVSHKIREPFSWKTECPDLDLEDGSLLSLTVDSANARLLNPRKLNVTSSISCDVNLFSAIKPIPLVTGTESIEDDMNLQRTHKTVSTAELATFKEKNVTASMDLELDSNEPPMAEILSCRVNMCPSDVRPGANGETHVRSDVMVSLLYRSEEGNYFSSEKRFVTEHIPTLPCTGAAEWMTKATPTEVTAQISSNTYGEMKIVELDFVYDLELYALTNHNVQVTTDMYSTEFESTSGSVEARPVFLHRVYNTGLSVNASITREEAKAASVRSILGGNATIKIERVNLIKDKNKLLVEGVADLALVAEDPVAEDSSSVYTPIAFSYPFRCELEAGEMPQEVSYLYDCKLSGSRFRVDSGRIYADLELVIRIASLGKQTVAYVDSLSLDKSRPVPRSAAPITLCYPSGKESLWDIAKYYKITEQSIVTSNGLSDSDISGRKVLLIPRYAPKKPVLSKVI